MTTLDFCEAVKSQKWSAASKAITHAIDEVKSKNASNTADLQMLYLNRAFVYRQLGMLRKAATDLDLVLSLDASNVTALVRKAEVLKALGDSKLQECHAMVQKALAAFTPFTDASLIVSAQHILDKPKPAETNGVSTPAAAQEKASAASHASTSKCSDHPACAKPCSKEHAAKEVTASSAASSSARSSSSNSNSSAATSAIPEALVPDQVLVQQAVEMINLGKTLEADGLLSRVVSRNSRDFAARLSRGTARALRRDLEGAIKDFSVAIEVLPVYGDAWKRRGQARSALGLHTDAVSDMEQAIKLATDPKVKAECHFEKGMIFNKLRDFRKAVKEFEQSTKLDGTNPQAWNLLGLCRTSMGDIQAGVDAYSTATKLQPTLREAWVNMAHALKEAARVKEAQAAFNKALDLDSAKKPSFQVVKLMAQMSQGCGDHKGAIDLLSKALKYVEADHKVEALYWRAVCNHALGLHRRAIEDYEACFNVDQSKLSDESKVQQVLAFYQKEMALYIRNNLDKDVYTFCLDADLNPVFKELWCKKQAPTQELLSIYQEIAQKPLPKSPGKPPPPPDSARLAVLLKQADKLGKLLQYRHQGFLPNKRQQRMGGLAAIELAQTIRQLVSSRQNGRETWLSSEGASSKGGCSGRHQFGWRDAMDIVVKWRQLAEPNDQVLWVDMLTRAEFEAGFGSHTPMFSGQTKCVRYYMNFERALQLHKKVLLEEGKAYDAANNPLPVTGDKVKRVHAAKTAEAMWLIIEKDSWVVVPIQSVTREGHSMEGTRLTLVKVPNQADAYEFSIRTPVTPPRWDDFDKELEGCFERVLDAMCQGDFPEAAERILQYCYYWYNFMPLARGTAVVGYITLLALFMAARMSVTANIPKDYQVDWEAILSQHPHQFVDSLRGWLYPPPAKGQAAEPSGDAMDVDKLPSVAETLNTMRIRLEALNGPDSPRI